MGESKSSVPVSEEIDDILELDSILVSEGKKTSGHGPIPMWVTEQQQSVPAIRSLND